MTIRRDIEMLQNLFKKDEQLSPIVLEVPKGLWRYQMQAGGYTLDLYCDVKDCRVKAEFYHELGSVCRKTARLAGWFISQSGKDDRCPACSGKNDRRAKYSGYLAQEIVI